MSDHIDSASLQQTLSNLEPDDWIGRMVLAREAALFPEAAARANQPPEQQPRPPMYRIRTPDGPQTSIDVACPPKLVEHPATPPLQPTHAHHGSHQLHTEFKCPIDSCPYDGTFSRKYELRRHIAAQHKSIKKYRCCAVDCFKGPSAPAFARFDKLTDHIRAIHYSSHVRYDCPMPNCLIDTGLHLSELAVHLKLAHRNVGLMLNAVKNASNKRACMIWNCRKQIPSRTYGHHLSTHTVDELAAVSAEMLDQGYILNGTNVSLWCRVDTCVFTCSDEDDLTKHIKSQHGNDTLDRNLKANFLRQCPSLASEHLFDYLRTTSGVSAS